jgi:hypothetical protein
MLPNMKKNDDGSLTVYIQKSYYDLDTGKEGWTAK